MAGMDTDTDNPCNSSIMRRLEEGKRLPWHLVKHTTWFKLANKLDLPSPVSNNNWKGLAELLGFSTEDILVLGNSKERSTVALFTNYLPKKNASVNKVAEALKQMNRDDALQILLDAVPDIDAETHNSTMETVDGDDSCLTNMAQGSCGCLGSSALPCSGHHHGAAACSPCHSHPRHHPHSHSHCTVVSGGCCCHHVGGVRCHNPSAPCSSIMHPHSHTSRASPLGGCMGMVAGGLPSMGSQNYNTPASETSYKSHTSGMRNQDFYGTSSPVQKGVRTSPVLHQPHLHSSSIQQYPQDVGHASYQQMMQESMVVHQGRDSPDHSAFHSLMADNGNMEVDGDVREEPALLHTAIGRAKGLISISAMNPQGLPLDMQDMGDDTPSTSLEELSSSDSSSRQSSMPPNVMRQVSEEQNANQPYVPLSKSRPGYGNGEGSGAGPQWRGDHRNAARDGQRVGGSQVNGYANKEGQSCLEQLMALSKMPNRFKPDSKYTSVVAEQQIEEVGSNPKGTKVQIKRERVSNRSGLAASARGTNNSKPKGGGLGADTYPLRVKPQSGGTTVEQVLTRQQGMLTKTTSVPIDMKMKEFKKAFRHIKVFVTYAKDSKHHCRLVLSLCNCLDRNGFSCCADMSPSNDVPDHVTRDWCGRKFKEADFVLVCLSPMYLQEIKACEGVMSPRPSSSNSRSDRGSLHTAYIYQLMLEEYQTTKRCSRFVPLYMAESLCGAGPSWLTRPLSYHWPRQYMDLLWMLTKPEDRIKQRSRSSPQKGNVTMRVNGHCNDQT